MSATVLIGQAPTNLGPLTTTFTPPPACTVAVGAGRGGLAGLFGGGGDKDVAWLGQGCSRGRAFDATTCWPETSSGAEAKSAPLNGWGFYSPGLHCPAGYTTACSATGGSGGESGWPVQFQLRDGETAVGCCPSGYGCANVNGQTCTMIATSATIPTVTCDGSRSGDFAFQTIPDEAASITAFSLFAPMIQINWQSSDQPQTTAESSTATPTSTDNRVTATGTKTVDEDAASGEETLILAPGDENGTGTINVDFGSGATTTPTLQETDGSSDDSGGISSGARVAIAAAGSALVLVLVVCAFFYWWRRRRNQREEQELDRLYGMKHTMNDGGDFRSNDEIPGWYRGQRLATPPANDPFSGAGLGGGGVERPAPAAPFYQPYRS